MRTEEVLAIAESMLDKRIRAVPRIEVPKIEVGNGPGDEEVQIVLFSDLQTGLKFPGFSARILQNRVHRLARRVGKITAIHRTAYPIRRLAVFALGDMVHNDRIGRVISLDELEKVVMDQVYEVAVPCFTEFLLAMRQVFSEIDVYTVDGNHGSLGKFAAVKTNWDNIVYRTTALGLREYPEIRWHIETEKFWQKVQIWKWTFLLVHGDAIPMHLTLPWYGLTTRAMRWQGSLPGKKFRYMCLGHFHTASSVDWNEMEIFVNGSFVTSNQWVLKKLGLASSTIQWTMGCHPRKGVSWRYKLRLD